MADSSLCVEEKPTPDFSAKSVQGCAGLRIFILFSISDNLDNPNPQALLGLEERLVLELVGLVQELVLLREVLLQQV